MVHVYTYIFFLSVYGICMVYQVNDDVSRIFKLELQDFLIEKKIKNNQRFYISFRVASEDCDSKF